jgi:hypothetical protein
VLTLLFVLALVMPAGYRCWGGEAAPPAASGWKAEFDGVCGQTDNAISMTEAELRRALEKCDALRGVIAGLEETPRKIYLKRLQMCRNLFSYLLETRLKAEQK